MFGNKYFTIIERNFNASIKHAELRTKIKRSPQFKLAKSASPQLFLLVRNCGLAH